LPLTDPVIVFVTDKLVKVPTLVKLLVTTDGASTVPDKALASTKLAAAEVTLSKLLKSHKETIVALGVLLKLVLVR
jgi:hypothetical protein